MEREIIAVGYGARKCFNRYEILVPAKWIEHMGITSEHPDEHPKIQLIFDDDQIIIKSGDEYPAKRAPFARSLYRFSDFGSWVCKNHSSIPDELFNHFFSDIGDEFLTLGFESDDEGICAAFPDLRYDEYETWIQIVDQIEDIQLLGNTIFSQWLWWDHWACSAMEESDYKWFASAFSRLAELASRQL